jgi:tRNA(Leu) C34 or U34 (ribose-2'-O)-methylase TrmL
MESYEAARRAFKPDHIKVLFIAESQPPAAGVTSSRQFYRTDQIYPGDRLFVNTIKALYGEADDQTEKEIEAKKSYWLNRFSSDGYYMIEALDESLPHEATKQERQEKIRSAIPTLLKKVDALASEDTRLILIKSNVFEVATEPLRNAGYSVLNHELVDYPGQYNQRAYREKVRSLLNL